MAPDPWAKTQPTRNSKFYNPPGRIPPTAPRWMRKQRRSISCGCGPFLGGLFLAVASLLLVYFLAPVRTNILILGIDYTPPENAVGRSDTIILSTMIPFEPYVGLLSIPRDLWVTVPGVGENRINTAHFFAEGQQAGTGPQAAIDTIQQNFGVHMDYFIRIRFDGFRSVVNAMGGVDIELDQPMAGYPAGKYHLTGNKALAFARNRLGSDDFFRMKQGQLLIKSIVRQLLRPRMWPRLPAVVVALSQNLDTNVPWFQWPRLGMALLRAGPDGFDSQTIEREMVTPYTTNQGASVLLPIWPKIKPVIVEMFGE